MFTNAEIQWVDRFVMKLESLTAAAESAPLMHLAHELYPDLNVLPPEDVAEIEWQASIATHRSLS